MMILHLPKDGRRKSGDLFELRGQMRDAAITQPVGDLAEAPFVIAQPFLDLFDLLLDEVFFDRDAFHLGEKFTERGIFAMHSGAEEFGEYPGWRIPLNVFDHRGLDLFDDAALLIAEHLEPEFAQPLLDYRQLIGARRRGQRHLAQLHRDRLDTRFPEQPVHHIDAPVTDHIFDMQRRHTCRPSLTGLTSQWKPNRHRSLMMVATSAGT